MESLRVEILNPKAKNLLFDLADLKLISIKKWSSTQNDFKKLLEKLRSKSDSAPSLEEITEEVEIVRKERYEA